jgi:putative membrane protein
MMGKEPVKVRYIRWLSEKLDKKVKIDRIGIGKMMMILVLSVDRDNDFGEKAGFSGPFIGREDNLEAALALGLKDAEDSDTNTLLAAIGMYDEMVKKGMDVEVATICGDIKVGYESDLTLTTQLENVLEVVKPERVILVSDGAEDEYIYPIISSRVKVDSVRKVFVKQAPSVEGTYYILLKTLQDDKMRKRILTPIGLILALFGFFSLVPKLYQFYMDGDPGTISEMAGGTIALVLGIYLIFYAYRVGDRTRNWSIRAGRAVRSGSQMIPFAVLTVVFIIAGLAYGVDAALSDPDADIFLQIIVFVSANLWMWAFAIFCYETGRFLNHYLSKGKVYWTYLVLSVTVFAIAFILQGALDASEFFLGYRSYDEGIIILEMMTGFLLGVFGGLLNTSLRNMAKRTEDGGNEVSETAKSAD